MKYKLKTNPVNWSAGSPITEYLLNLGITKPESFLQGPAAIDEASWINLRDIRLGLDMLKKHIDQKSNILVIVDSDTDGYMSAATLTAFLFHLDPTISLSYYIHPEKEHGVFPYIVGYDCDLVIVPDAGSNQIDELQEISNRADILVIDHHIVDVDARSDKVVIINNQTSDDFSNKNLSGAGMVYKFIQAYSDVNNLGNLYSKFIDLAAIGIVADAMDSRNLDNNYIITKGLKKIYNPMIKALLDKRAFSVSSVDSPNKIDIAFYVAPLINGLIRFADMELKYDFFDALINYHHTKTHERVWRNEVKVENHYEFIARRANNAKVAQDTAVLKVMDILKDRIESNGLDKHKIIVCQTSISNPNEVSPTLTGLVAMKLCTYYQKPVAVVRPTQTPNGLMYAGSGRAIAADNFDSFKNFLFDSGLVVYSQGHDMAFGVGIMEDKIEELLAYSDEHLKDIDFGSKTIEVDSIFKVGERIPVEKLMQFAAADFYGNGIPEPLFVFSLVLDSSSVAVMGKKQNTLKIMAQNLTFIKFFAQDLIEELQEINGLFSVDIIAKCSLNTFAGRTNLQAQIEHLNIKERSVSLF